MRSQPFSNGTEQEMFEWNWCRRCPLAFEGDSMCDDAALPVLLDEEWPEIFIETPRSADNPLGIICTQKPDS